MVVDASQDIAVAVRQDKPGGVDIDNGFTATGSSAFKRTDTTLYAPAVYANIYNVNSKLQVINTAMTMANVTFYFKGRAGYSDATWGPITIASYGRYTLNANSIFGSAWVGSIKLSSNQPVTFRVFDEFTGGTTRTSNTAAGGSTILYAPALYKAAFNLTSGIVVQNVGSTSTNVTGEFYNRNGTPAGTYSLGAVGAERAAGVYLGSLSEQQLPSGWMGSARIVSSEQPIAAMVTTDRPGAGVYAYNAADSSSPKSTVYLPRIAKQVGGRTTSFLILNTSASAALQVTARYYTTSGTQTSEFTVTLPARGSAGYYQGNDTFLPPGWEGSVLLQANGPTLVAILREELSSSDWASLSAANGIGR